MKDDLFTAGIIIIGNEILTGKVHDVNSFYLASELRSLGIEVRRIHVIPDEPEAIGRDASLFSKKYDYVFTTGGVGPTHDDVTMSGIARGFGVKLLSHPEIKRVLSERYGSSLNDAVLKMTEVPEGSEVIFYEGMRFPIVSFRNIFIFPGIPGHIRNKFPLIKQRFRSGTVHIRMVFLKTSESEIAGILNRVVEDNLSVIFGSYPVQGNPEYNVKITAESRSENSLNKAVEELLRKLPEGVVLKTE